MKYLILGDGKLAKELQIQTNWDIISRKKDGFDITNKEAFGFPTMKNHAYFDMLNSYDVIINCIGYTNTYSDERDLHWNVNYLGVIYLANWCNAHNKKLVQISTDYVYAGSNSEAKETDIPVHHKSWYAYTKLLADGYVQAMSNDYLLVRTTFKPRPFPHEKAWDNIIGNFEYVDAIARILKYVIEDGVSGVLNVGTFPKTYFDLGVQTNKDVERSNDVDFEHPSDVTMDLTKLHSI